MSTFYEAVNLNNKDSREMKMVMISYNEAVEEEISEALEKLGIIGYTKWINVLGRGRKGGEHLGSHVWPGKNCVVFLAVDEGKKNGIIQEIMALRKAVGHEGIKAFVMPLEEAT
jgi:nitrogen regulatory protein PII